MNKVIIGLVMLSSISAFAGVKKKFENARTLFENSTATTGTDLLNYAYSFWGGDIQLNTVPTYHCKRYDIAEDTAENFDLEYEMTFLLGPTPLFQGGEEVELVYLDIEKSWNARKISGGTILIEKAAANLNSEQLPTVSKYPALSFQIGFAQKASLLRQSKKT